MIVFVLCYWNRGNAAMCITLILCFTHCLLNSSAFLVRTMYLNLSDTLDLFGYVSVIIALSVAASLPWAIKWHSVVKTMIALFFIAMSLMVWWK